VIGGAIVWQANFAAIFYATAAIGVLAYLIANTLPEPPTSDKPKLDDDDDFLFRSLWQVVRQPELLTWYLVIVGEPSVATINGREVLYFIYGLSQANGSLNLRAGFVRAS
jgi:hypothetical protein